MSTRSKRHKSNDVNIRQSSLQLFDGTVQKNPIFFKLGAGSFIQRLKSRLPHSRGGGAYELYCSQPPGARPAVWQLSCVHLQQEVECEELACSDEY